MQQLTSLTETWRSFTILHSRCWKLCEECDRKLDTKDTSYTSLHKFQEDTVEFVDVLLLLTQQLGTLRRQNEALTVTVSDSLRNLSSLRRRKNQLEGILNEFVELTKSSILEFLRLQPAWKLLDSSDVEKAYGPRIAGLVNRTIQTENQSRELEILKNRCSSYWLSKQLQKLHFCAFPFFHLRQSGVYILSNILHNSRERLFSETGQRIESVQFRLKLKNPDIASPNSSTARMDVTTLCTCLTFIVEVGETWSVSIEESLLSELSEEYPSCSYGSRTSSKGHPLVEIDIEPKIPEENIRRLRNLCFELSNKFVCERISLVTSELPYIFPL